MDKSLEIEASITKDEWKNMMFEICDVIDKYRHMVDLKAKRIRVKVAMNVESKTPTKTRKPL